MNRFGDQIFTSSRFSLQQYGRNFALGDFVRQRQHLTHCWRLAHNLIKAKLLRAFAAKQVHFLAQVAGFNAIPNRDLQLFEVDRLTDEVVRTSAQGRDRFVNQNVGGNHYYYRIGLAMPNLAQNFEA